MTRRWWGVIEEVAGVKGLRVGMLGNYVSGTGTGYVPFGHGHELLVHGWCDMVSHGCFRSNYALSRLVDKVA